MQGHIRRRGKGGSYEYIIDIGVAPAQRCQSCGRRFWVERRPLAACQRCGGALRLAEERRRQTKAGFSSRKEAQAALNKVLVAVAERSYMAPSRETLEQFLTDIPRLTREAPALAPRAGATQVDLPATGGSAENRRRGSHPHPPPGRREPALGLSPHPG